MLTSLAFGSMLKFNDELISQSTSNSFNLLQQHTQISIKMTTGFIIYNMCVIKLSIQQMIRAIQHSWIPLETCLSTPLTQSHTHAHMHARKHAHASMHTQAHTHIHTHTNTHTNIHTRRNQK